MFGEVPKLSDSSNEGSSPHLKVRTIETSSSFKRRVSRFFQQFANLFTKEEAIEQEPPLMGRVHELEASGRQVLHSLLALKKMMEAEIDPSLVAAAHALIDPIIREIRRLLNQMELKQDLAQQVKVSNRYTESLEKGKRWVSTLSNGPSGDEIQEFIKLQVLEEFRVRIDRDLQLIQDYLDHTLLQPGIDASSRQAAVADIGAELGPLLDNLHRLKEPQAVPDLEAFFSWRSAADELREDWITSALQIIDLRLQG